MLFNSLAFLVFLPAFLILYGASRGRARLGICLVGSYLFYGWWDWRFLSLIWLSTIVDYAAGRLLGIEARPRRRRALLMISVCVNLGLLGTFKYFDFFVGSFAELLRAAGVDAEPRLLTIVLPVGISFYTFQTLSYTIDVYRRRIEVETSLLRFATFVAFFPQLVAGPIVRAGRLLPQLRRDRRPTREDVLTGLQLVLWGYFLKVVVADSLALVADERFAYPELHGGLSLIIGVLAFGFQIYGDFCGYSSIAIGLGRILGFDFGVNFDRPYFSASFSEFWRRWHISLSTWLRDYLYIPLGGSRRGPRRTLVNLAITMFLGGLWHGANWTFVVWGLLHGLYLVLQRVLGPTYATLARTLRVPAGVSRVILTAVVFGLTSFAWVFFRAASLEEAWLIVQRVFNFAEPGFAGVRDAPRVAGALALMGALTTAEALSFKYDPRKLALDHPALLLLVGGILLAAILLFGQFSGKAFIYFQF